MNQPRKPLDGIRVLSSEIQVAGPYCTMMLADHGAQVVKVEQPKSGDTARRGAPLVKNEQGQQQSGYFLRFNRNKRSLTLNLKSDAGRQIFRDLAQQSDVLVENFRPGLLLVAGRHQHDLALDPAGRGARRGGRRHREHEQSAVLLDDPALGPCAWRYHPQGSAGDRLPHDRQATGSSSRRRGGPGPPPHCPGAALHHRRQRQLQHVEGDQIYLECGDLVLNPPWLWHNHGSDSDERAIWMDGLDIPLTNYLDTSFFEPYSGDVQQVTKIQNSTVLKYGVGTMRPAWEARSASYSPTSVFKWHDTERALNNLAQAEAASPFDDVALEYINSHSGGPVMKTMSCWTQMLRPGVHTQAHRQVGSAVYYVVEGQGATVIGGVRFDWEQGDMFVIPSWAYHEHCNASAQQRAILFSIHDTPVMIALDKYRPDLAIFMTQASQQGFHPKAVTVGKAALFPAAVEAIGGGLGNGLSTEIWWTPNHPFKSSLTGASAKDFASAYQKDIGKQWTQPIGFVHALFEIAAEG